jgi:hypothetical protein
MPGPLEPGPLEPSQLLLRLQQAIAQSRPETKSSSQDGGSFPSQRPQGQQWLGHMDCVAPPEAWCNIKVVTLLPCTPSQDHFLLWLPWAHSALPPLNCSLPRILD